MSKCVKDHPRLCGEKFDRLSGGVPEEGSPPPMRGKDFLQSHAVSSTRITPAYAGKSAAELPSIFVDKDHPRLCGEKQHTKTAMDSKQGSPPPMRGKAIPVLVPLPFLGITPAYAGKSKNHAE